MRVVFKGYKAHQVCSAISCTIPEVQGNPLVLVLISVNQKILKNLYQAHLGAEKTH